MSKGISKLKGVSKSNRFDKSNKKCFNNMKTSHFMRDCPGRKDNDDYVQVAAASMKWWLKINIYYIP